VRPGHARHLRKRHLIVLEGIERGTAPVMKPVWPATLGRSLARVLDVPLEFLFADIRRRKANVFGDLGPQGAVPDGDQRVGINQNRIPCGAAGHLDEIIAGIVLGSLTERVDVLFEEVEFVTEEHASGIL